MKHGSDSTGRYRFTGSVLSLGGLGMGSSMCRDLARALAESPAVTDVDLSDNAIGDAGAEALAAVFVAVTPRKVRLVLSRNGITDHGALALSRAATVSDSLWGLDLSGNPLRGDLQAEWVQWFSVTRSLRVLSLQDTLIELPLAARLIAGIAASNKTIIEALFPARLGPPLLRELDSVLRCNREVLQRAAAPPPLTPRPRRRLEATHRSKAPATSRTRSVAAPLSAWQDAATGPSLLCLALLDRASAPPRHCL